MKNILLVIRNLALRHHVSQEILQEIEDITEILEEAILSHGKSL